jgi:putative endonuclease
MSWYLYVIECRGGSLYTGVTTDVARRFVEHAAGKGARYTRAHPPERLLLVLEFADRASAQKEEYRIKQLRREQKLAWCQAQPAWQDSFD